jgi:hypothetical protein
MTQHYFCYAIGAGNDFNDSNYESIEEALEKAQGEYNGLCESQEQTEESDEILLVQEFYFDEDGERKEVAVQRHVVEFAKEESDYEEHGTNR